MQHSTFHVNETPIDLSNHVWPRTQRDVWLSEARGVVLVVYGRGKSGLIVKIANRDNVRIALSCIGSGTNLWSSNRHETMPTSQSKIGLELEQVHNIRAPYTYYFIIVAGRKCNSLSYITVAARFAVGVTSGEVGRLSTMMSGGIACVVICNVGSAHYVSLWNYFPCVQIPAARAIQTNFSMYEAGHFFKQKIYPGGVMCLKK